LSCLAFVGLELPCVEDLSCLAFVGLELPCVEDLSCLAFVGLELPCVEDLSCLAFVGIELPCVEDLSCLWPLGSCEVLDFHPRKTIPGKSLYLNHPKRKVHEIFVLEFLESSFFESFWDIREADLV